MEEDKERREVERSSSQRDRVADISVNTAVDLRDPSDQLQQVKIGQESSLEAIVPQFCPPEPPFAVLLLPSLVVFDPLLPICGELLPLLILRGRTTSQDESAVAGKQECGEREDQPLARVGSRRQSLQWFMLSSYVVDLA